MDILQETALAIIGFAGGVSVAAGTFALITALGIIPRLASRMGVTANCKDELQNMYINLKVPSFLVEQ